MLLNLRIEGLPEEIVNALVEQGIASNKSEAIRLMILHYNEHFGIKPIEQFIEDELAVKKVQALEKGAKEGKRKTLSEEEALRKYRHLMK
ncbi:MAG: hypothetical protein AB1657_01460 [Candidatus Micrarchaeota archaeon]